MCTIEEADLQSVRCAGLAARRMQSWAAQLPDLGARLDGRNWRRRMDAGYLETSAVGRTSRSPIRGERKRLTRVGYGPPVCPTPSQGPLAKAVFLGETSWTGRRPTPARRNPACGRSYPAGSADSWQLGSCAWRPGATWGCRARARAARAPAGAARR